MLPADFFDPVLIESISALAALRAVVLERTTKRMPKWQFRITDDITIQIQPKPAVKKLRPYGYPGGFECEAVEDPGDDLGTRSMRFFLFLNPDGTWSLKMTRIGYRRSHTEDEKRPRAVERRDRMIWLSPRVFATLRPEMMLSGGCLVCGKKLTDPISQARWIGPECNQSTTALNPFLIRLQEAAELDEFYELVCAGSDGPVRLQRCSLCSLVVSDQGRKCETCAHRIRRCDCGAYKGRTDLPPQFQDCMRDCPRVEPEASIPKHTVDQVRATIERIKRRAAGKPVTIRGLH